MEQKDITFAGVMGMVVLAAVACLGGALVAGSVNIITQFVRGELLALDWRQGVVLVGCILILRVVWLLPQWLFLLSSLKEAEQEIVTPEGLAWWAAQLELKEREVAAREAALGLSDDDQDDN